ncbi:hypothetical protein [Bacillus sp. REN3]|uniref:hypothetical protein n=1 Tax=Bacillus sp. REN3 TaxID=2802440 RepID=UPI001AED8BE4|nr:hypothetical protein [Bacillus sp. REN3]
MSRIIFEATAICYDEIGYRPASYFNLSDESHADYLKTSFFFELYPMTFYMIKTFTTISSTLSFQSSAPYIILKIHAEWTLLDQ